VASSTRTIGRLRTPVQFSESFEIDGQQMYQHAYKVGLDGVVSKVRDSAYVSGRGNIVKKTCQQRETLTAGRTRTSPPSKTGSAPPR
jgi:ATP-dependent DNA ligase